MQSFRNVKFGRGTVVATLINNRASMNSEYLYVRHDGNANTVCDDSISLLMDTFLFCM